MAAAILLGVGTYLPLTLLAPLEPTAAVSAAEEPAATPPVSYRLPAAGISALGLRDGTELLASEGADEAYPMASITKIITALVVLEKYPLAAGESGPSVRMGRADEAFYEDYYLRGAKLLRVVTGWTFTERELLEIVLVDSAANYASSLSRWAFASDANFAAAARKWLSARGLTGITVVEPVGLDPKNTATPAALVQLGRIALADPLVADLVKTTTLSMHDVGTLENTNELLGTDGVTGIKTGTLDDYGASLLFSAEVSTLGEPVALVGAVLGSGNHNLLNQEVRTLLASVQANYHTVTLTTRDQVFGSFTTPWGDTADAIVETSESMIVWGDQPITMQVDIDSVTTAFEGDRVGLVVFTSGGQTVRVPLVLTHDIEDPGPWWRIGHPGIVGGDW